MRSRSSESSKKEGGRSRKWGMGWMSQLQTSGYDGRRRDHFRIEKIESKAEEPFEDDSEF